MVQIGFIKYSNCFPIYYGFKNKKLDFEKEILLDYPISLNLAMKEKRLDISSISSIEYVKNKNQYLLIDNISLNSKGYVKSVIFFSNKKINNLSNSFITLSPFSATSSIILKILLEYFKNKNVKYTNKIKTENSFLLIGDDALKYKNKNYCYQYDLGKLWFEIFEKPIIFGLWAINKKSLLNKEIDIRKCVDALLESKEIFKNKFNQIVKQAKKNYSEISIDFNEYYHCLKYDFDLEEKQAFLFFINKATEINLCPKIKKLIFFK